jgi:hypothetical protein
MSPFFQALSASLEGKIRIPEVSSSEGSMDYFGYQLAVHLFNLRLMAHGLKFEGITFNQIKEYYGLKGRRAADCIQQLEAISKDYKVIMSQKE